MDRYFSNTPLEDKSFPFFTSAHYIPIILTILLIYFIVRNRDYIRASSHKVRFILGIILAISIGLKQYWYITSEMPYIQEGMPLYLCRLTFLITIFSFLTNFRKLDFVIIYQGSFGGLMAILVPDVSGYLFPHFFYINYFLTHALLLCAALVVLYGDDFVASKKQFINILIYNFTYVVFVSIVNEFLGTNYGYTSEPPASLSILNGIVSGIPYKLAVFGIISLLALISHLFYKAITYKTKKSF